MCKNDLFFKMRAIGPLKIHCCFTQNFFPVISLLKKVAKKVTSKIKFTPEWNFHHCQNTNRNCDIFFCVISLLKNKEQKTSFFNLPPKWVLQIFKISKSAARCKGGGPKKWGTKAWLFAVFGSIFTFSKSAARCKSEGSKKWDFRKTLKNAYFCIKLQILSLKP